MRTNTVRPYGYFKIRLVLGITFGQQRVDDKENEVPAVRELLGLLKLEGCIVVADALHCQKETANAIVKAKADYLLSVKDNQETLKKDIEDYVQDDDLRQTMDTFSTFEKNSGRIEKRTAFATSDNQQPRRKQRGMTLQTALPRF